METLQWVLAVIPGVVIVALFTLPIFGVLAWLYAKPRVGMPAPVRLKNTL